MSFEPVVRSVAGRLSLRAPQRESLERLSRSVSLAPDVLKHGERDLPAVLAQLQAAFPTLTDFEREFPSLCFALATGVGKTRLMGAFISYLYLAHGIENFFVLAPNLTIYDKLIADFTPNTPKYVFKGIAEFATSPPEIITGDNYEQRAAQVQGGLLSPVTINIFNISKINSEVRGGKSPRIKRLSEYIGQSYFDYLAALPDLVLLMDESHRYRASAGVRAINELKPLLGLEVTATPFVETGGKGGPVPFRNVVMDYPLARAMDDGFVKTPAVVTQRNFNASQYPADALEGIKLRDGVRLHEATKVELTTYAHQNGVPAVKPFMLVIARDTTHAAALLGLIQSEIFFEGRYRDKAIQVDSSKSGADEEEMIRRLLAVESVDEPTEIVIHVNMLKEGWDVTNLYTIVPLRAANARTLIEQSIGRGLRLPYGRRTGVAAVDRLNIVAHDRFQEIVDEANRADSPIRLQQLILEAPEQDERKTTVDVSSSVETTLGQATADAFGGVFAPVFEDPRERDLARVVMEVLATYEVQREKAPGRETLLQPDLQREIVAAVRSRMKPAQGELLPDEAPLNVEAVVAKTTEVLVARTIDIPRIVVVPSGEVTSGFRPFELDVRGFASLQPGERDILIQNLHNHEQQTLAAQVGLIERRPEDYIVHALIDFDDIDYDIHAVLLYDLAGQAVASLRERLSSEDELRNVLDGYRRLIAENIHAQMMAHYDEGTTEYVAEVKRGFTALKPCSYSVAAGEAPRHFRETVTDVGRIKQMLFGGFAKCLYPLQRFDSDTERRFSVILEKDALKWFKPAKGQFQIFYRLGSEQPEYVPDFVVETADRILLCETKARADMTSDEVKAKATAAKKWCTHASDFGHSVGSKPWEYLLIPHDEVQENRKLDYFRAFAGGK